MDELLKLIKVATGNMGMGSPVSRANQGANQPVAPIQPMGGVAAPPPGQFKPSSMLSVANITSQQQQMPEVMNQQLTPQAPGPRPLEGMPSPGQPREGSPSPGSSQPKIAFDNSPASRLAALTNSGGVQPPRPFRQVARQKIIKQEPPTPTTPQELMRVQQLERQKLITDAFRKRLPTDQVRMQLAQLDLNHQSDQKRMMALNEAAAAGKTGPAVNTELQQGIQSAEQYQRDNVAHQNFHDQVSKRLAENEQKLKTSAGNITPEAEEQLRQSVNADRQRLMDNQRNWNQTKINFSVASLTNPLAKQHYDYIAQYQDLQKKLQAMQAPGAAPNPAGVAELQKQMTDLQAKQDQFYTAQKQTPPAQASTQPAASPATPTAPASPTTAPSATPATPEPPSIADLAMQNRQTAPPTATPTPQPVVQPPTVAAPTTQPVVQPPTVTAPTTQPVSAPASPFMALSSTAQGSQVKQPVMPKAPPSAAPAAPQASRRLFTPRIQPMRQPTATTVKLPKPPVPAKVPSPPPSAASP